jgi:DNA-binding TFAR19-related protein (PDSD5 family)
MILKDKLELSITREKLAELQEQYEATRKETGGNQSARELTLRSLKKLINQIIEEIARYEAHVGDGTR